MSLPVEYGASSPEVLDVLPSVSSLAVLFVPPRAPQDALVVSRTELTSAIRTVTSFESPEVVDGATAVSTARSAALLSGADVGIVVQTTTARTTTLW